MFDRKNMLGDLSLHILVHAKIVKTCSKKVDKKSCSTRANYPSFNTEKVHIL